MMAGEDDHLGLYGIRKPCEGTGEAPVIVENEAVIEDERHLGIACYDLRRGQPHRQPDLVGGSAGHLF